MLSLRQADPSGPGRRAEQLLLPWLPAGSAPSQGWPAVKIG
jgi:hypothetical protein